MTLILRSANKNDLEILKIWDEDVDVSYSGGEDDHYDWEFELNREVSWREILIAQIDHTPIGVVVLIDVNEEESHYWGNEIAKETWAIDIWIGDKNNRSKGYGTQMMKQAISRCLKIHLAKQVLIDPLASNVRAIEFYRRLGFKLIGPRRFGDDDCLVMSIDRVAFLRE